MKILINGKWVSITKVTASQLLKALLPDFEEENNKVLKVTDGVLSWASAGSGGYDGDPSVINQTASYRFVTDEQISGWESKAAGNHNHDSSYSALGHSHDYAASNHDHNLIYSQLSHHHDGSYASMNHNHNLLYSDINHNHNGAYSALGHNHNGVYSPIDHTHPDVYASRLVLASNVATGANVTPVNLTGMTFTYLPGRTYRIDIYGIVQAGAATTGHGFGVNCTTAPVTVCLGGGTILANTGTGSNWSAIANNAIVGVTSGLPSTNTNVMSLGGGIIRTHATNGGTCQFIFRSETTAVTTCMANTVILVTLI